MSQCAFCLKVSIRTCHKYTFVIEGTQALKGNRSAGGLPRQKLIRVRLAEGLCLAKGNKQ